jgi:cellulose synthase/poly-beta-1,6-N-acetylglucosamine synthase-like glycosyltransferase
MNFAMNLAYNVEERLSQIERPEDWTDADEDAAYVEVMEQVVKEDGRALAAGNIRIGDLILIVDSDTRVPEDCLLDAAIEFHDSPDIAILQHKSGVMQVVHNYWENGITYFTRLIYASITYAVAAGDIGPFVGYPFQHTLLTLVTTLLSDGRPYKK